MKKKGFSLKEKVKGLKFIIYVKNVYYIQSLTCYLTLIYCDFMEKKLVRHCEKVNITLLIFITSQNN